MGIINALRGLFSAAAIVITALAVNTLVGCSTIGQQQIVVSALNADTSTSDPVVRPEEVVLTSNAAVYMVAAIEGGADRFIFFECEAQQQPDAIRRMLTDRWMGRPRGRSRHPDHRP